LGRAPGQFEVVPTPESIQFAEALRTAERLRREARELMNRAGRACLVARQFEDHSRTDRRQREAWAAVLARLPLDPKQVVALCASCHRAEGLLGWTILPPGAEYRLMTWDRPSVSHGFCPDCLRRMTLTGCPATEIRAVC
jgi:hypothetical protein